MTFAQDYSDLLDNAHALASARNSTTKVEENEYWNLIERGRVFLPFLTDRGLSFAPSRFLGYKGNTVDAHRNRKNKDGSKTNIQIEKILMREFGLRIRNSEDADLESYFLDFCSAAGKKPGNLERTFWITPDVAGWLDANPNRMGISETTKQKLDEIEKDPSIPPTTKSQLIQARIGQGKFRRDVIRAYEKCLITNLSEEGLLIASHIKPWSECYKITDECLNPDNALLLSPTWDRLFDKGYVSFSDDGRLLVSKKLSKNDRRILEIPESLNLELTSGQKKFMRCHRAKYKF